MQQQQYSGAILFCLIAASSCFGLQHPDGAASEPVAGIQQPGRPDPGQRQLPAADRVVPATEASATEADQLDGLVQGQPINSGCVVLGGRYIEPPYVVAAGQGRLLINDHAVPTGQVREGIGGMKIRTDADSLTSAVAHIERLLMRGGVVLQLDRQTIALLPYGEGMRILSILATTTSSSQVQLQSLMLGKVEWVNTAQWTELIENFKPSEALEERLAEWEEEAAATASPDENARDTPGSIMYGMTVAGMILAVFALGTLVSYRPAGSARWTEVDGSPEAVRLVIRCVILLAVLNVLDLACTMMATSSAGFWELNPLGTRVAESPAVLAALKVGTTLVSSVILISLRCYRSAQLASWWLCLLCTIVTLRWVMFNSLFL